MFSLISYAAELFAGCPSISFRIVSMFVNGNDFSRGSLSSMFVRVLSTLKYPTCVGPKSCVYPLLGLGRENVSTSFMSSYTTLWKSSVHCIHFCSIGVDAPPIPNLACVSFIILQAFIQTHSVFPILSN